MIRVTQGHERGVGLEIFLKAYLCLSSEQKQSIKLFCSLTDLKNTLDSCLPNYSLGKKHLEYYGSKLKVEYVSGPGKATSLAIHKALEGIKSDDILVTLPSSKEQITTKEGLPTKGHTDLFRKIYPSCEIVMSFVSPHFNAALLTDHVSLKEVESELGDPFKKIIQAIKGLNEVRSIEEVFIAGVDPHCGEDGIIGTFDQGLKNTVEKVRKALPELKIYGPLPGDTILFNAPSARRCYLFPSHDQGLAPFKLANGLTGINLTLGLPFKRVSVDHGTAFDLYGKNQAGYQGMLYLLDEVTAWISKN